jgi:lambda repressor-like predicted transcriptional regulator
VILKEAIIGGTIYLDWIESENALPEAERVAFDYGSISNRKRIELLHKSADGIPNPADVALAAIDDMGKKVRNLKAADGTALDTVRKILDYPDDEMALATMIYAVGRRIWLKQFGGEQLKN